MLCAARQRYRQGRCLRQTLLVPLALEDALEHQTSQNKTRAWYSRIAQPEVRACMASGVAIRSSPFFNPSRTHSAFSKGTCMERDRLVLVNVNSLLLNMAAHRYTYYETLH
jgi:hypothetical protein